MLKKTIISITLYCFILPKVFSQLPLRGFVVKKLDSIQTIERSSDKIKELIKLNNLCLKNGMIRDSLRAQIMHLTGVYCFVENNLKDAIYFTGQSIAVNLSNTTNTKEQNAVRSLFNLAYFYLQSNRQEDAILAYKKCISIGFKYKASQDLVAESYREYCRILYEMGEYQKSYENVKIGIEKIDPSQKNT